MSREELINQQLGQTIAKKRKAAGFTQEQVAEHLGIGPEAFSRIERGKAGASVAKLFELATLFGCGVETFLVEGSGRTSEQAERMAQMLSELSSSDRQFMVSLVDRLAQRLKRDGKKPTAEEGGYALPPK